jgi:hypothetical protein
MMLRRDDSYRFLVKRLSTMPCSQVGQCLPLVHRPLIIFLILPEVENSGPFRHVPLDLFIQAGKQFPNRLLVDCCVSQGRFQARCSRKPLIPADLGPFPFPVESQEKGRFLL